ncbi:peptidase family S49-domain-containing protein [Coemansia spiralis]|nr:peptidase family S49-domain-containing protein [Coemansia spiralis]
MVDNDNSKADSAASKFENDITKAESTAPKPENENAKTSSANPKPKKQPGILRRSARFVWKYKKTSLFVTGIAYLAYRRYHSQMEEAKKNRIYPHTVLTWRITNETILTRSEQEIAILDALWTLEKAAEDPRVHSIVVRVAPSSRDQGEPITSGLGLAQTQELRKGRSYFYIDSFNDQSTYYLASAFSDIIVQPTGYLPLTGVSSTQFFFKDLADKLGIKPFVETRKEYKSIASQYSQTSMPTKQRENMVSILESLNSMFIADIGSARKNFIAASLQKTNKLDERYFSAAAIVRNAMEEGPLNALDAINLGLITQTGYILDVESIIGPRKAVSFSKYQAACVYEMRKNDEELEQENSFAEMYSKFKPDILKPLKNISRLLDDERPITVGVVYLNGAIVRSGSNGAGIISKAIMDAGKDTSVLAIVLRIDSGGGDVIASDTIGAAVDYVQKHFGKPVIASYSNMAASGAYYASTSCKKIFASPGTITGSIGVASMRPIFTRKLLDYIGTNVEEIYTIPNQTKSAFREPEGAELARFQRSIDKIYEDFTSRVAEGRGYTSEQVEAVARGQVFTGVQALYNGLVDELGGFTRAIEAAAQMGYDERETIVSSLGGYYKDKLVNNVVYTINVLQDLKKKEIDEAAALGIDVSDHDAKLAEDNRPVSPENIKITIKTKMDGKDKTTNTPVAQENNNGENSDTPAEQETKEPYKADILNNIRIKVFPEKSLIKSIVSQITGDDDSDIDKFSSSNGSAISELTDSGFESPYFQLQASFRSAVSKTLQRELEQLVSQNKLQATASKWEKEQREPKAEMDNIKFD